MVSESLYIIHQLKWVKVALFACIPLVGLSFVYVYFYQLGLAEKASARAERISTLIAIAQSVDQEIGGLQRDLTEIFACDGTIQSEVPPDPGACKYIASNRTEASKLLISRTEDIRVELRMKINGLVWESFKDD